MSTLLAFGLGFSARCYVETFGARWDRVIGTVRETGENAHPPTPGRVEILPFDGAQPRAELRAALGETDALLISIPPVGGLDPTLRCLGDNIATSRRIRSIVYLSTVGVYGDHDGVEVDETTPPRPVSDRSRARLAAEQAWSEIGAQSAIPVALLRLAGIYGPGRNTLVGLREGTARRVVKPGQVFNRVHVADVARAIDAAFVRRASGPFNVCDDEPCPPQDVVAFAAELLGLPAPPEQSFAAIRASLSPMARSFYGENKRVRNDRLKRELGVELKYPTYRDGLRALAAG